MYCSVFSYCTLRHSLAMPPSFNVRMDCSMNSDMLVTSHQSVIDRKAGIVVERGRWQL